MGTRLLDALGPYAALDGKGGVQQIRQLLPLEDWEALNGQIRRRRTNCWASTWTPPTANRRWKCWGKPCP